MTGGFLQDFHIYFLIYLSSLIHPPVIFFLLITLTRHILLSSTLLDPALISFYLANIVGHK